MITLHHRIVIDVKHFEKFPHSWFNHTGCDFYDRDRDMDEWVVWFYVEPFTLHLNRDRGWHLLSPIVLVPIPVLVLALDTASVITPSEFHTSSKISHCYYLGSRLQRVRFLRILGCTKQVFFSDWEKRLLIDINVKRFWYNEYSL